MPSMEKLFTDLQILLKIKLLSLKSLYIYRIKILDFKNFFNIIYIKSNMFNQMELFGKEYKIGTAVLKTPCNKAQRVMRIWQILKPFDLISDGLAGSN